MVQKPDDAEPDKGDTDIKKRIMSLAAEECVKTAVTAVVATLFRFLLPIIILSIASAGTALRLIWNFLHGL